MARAISSPLSRYGSSTGPPLCASLQAIEDGLAERAAAPAGHVRPSLRRPGSLANGSCEVANWHSVASEPVATFVDPPIGLKAELSCDNDVVPATVALTWKSSNFESCPGRPGGRKPMCQAESHGGVA